MGSSSSGLSFASAPHCGDAIWVSSNGCVATRNPRGQTASHILFSSRPLEVDELFEVCFFVCVTDVHVWVGVGEGVKKRKGKLQQI